MIGIEGKLTLVVRNLYFSKQFIYVFYCIIPFSYWLSANTDIYLFLLWI